MLTRHDCSEIIVGRKENLAWLNIANTLVLK